RQFLLLDGVLGETVRVLVMFGHLWLFCSGHRKFSICVVVCLSRLLLVEPILGSVKKRLQDKAFDTVILSPVLLENHRGNPAGARSRNSVVNKSRNDGISYMIMLTNSRETCRRA